MKYLKYICFIFLLIPSMVLAIDINTDTIGSMNISYQYGETKISDSNIYIYKIADYSGDGVLTYTDKFNLTNSLNISTTEEVIELADILNNYISENNIEYIKKCVTDSYGLCKISNLNVGLYLIRSTSKTNLEKQYYANPSLVSLPLESDITDELMYDIDIILKTEVKDVSCPECNVKKFTIKTSVRNGSIDPDQVVENEQDATINYKPNNGYKLSKIIIDGEEVDITKYSSNYTFEKVSKDHFIEVIYEIAEEPSIIPPDLTKTLDDIFTYIFLFGVSIIFIVMISYAIYKLNKIKKENKKEGKVENEKNSKNN